jgi:hypothetical protein
MVARARVERGRTVHSTGRSWIAHLATNQGLDPDDPDPVCLALS